jgi:hypothetical protein
VLTLWSTDDQATRAPVFRDMVTSFFEGPEPPVDGWSVICWWEARRIPFNLLVGAYGAACLAILFWAIATSGHIQPGENAVEPIALLAAPFGINVLYTLGWLVEVPARLLVRDLSPRFGPMLLRLGVGMSAVLIALPAAFWVGYRLLQWAGLVN